jgi:hypothetical protein
MVKQIVFLESCDGGEEHGLFTMTAAAEKEYSYME